VDGSPSVANVTTIKVPNTTLTDNTGGVVTLASPLAIQDIDGTPNVSNVSRIYTTNGFLSDLGSGSVLLSLSGSAGGGGAPTDATYITQTANGTLSNEQALSSLSSGLMYVTTGTGVVSSIPLASDKVTRTAGDVTLASDTFTDVTSMSITMTTGARRVMIAVVASGHIDATNNIMLDIDIDGARVGSTTYGILVVKGDSTKNKNLSFTFVTDVLSAASHTFKLKMARESSGTFTLFASTTVTPLVMAAMELPN
jgi:hypothetical protein